MGKNDDLAEKILRLYAQLHTDEGIVVLTYGDLATRLGRPGQHRLLGDPLDRLRELCAARGLPDVATVVVDKPSLQAGTLSPSSKAFGKYDGWPSLRKEQARVISYDWSGMKGDA